MPSRTPSTVPPEVAESPSSSVQRARQQLADRLRDLRLDAGLNGKTLSDAAGWHPAKTTRIEGAKQAPSEDDIRTWCRVCDAEREAPDLIAASRAADSMYVEWRRVQPSGLRHTQEARVPLYERTRVFKAYCPSVIPGWLQTPAYATALLSAISAFHGTPDDTEEAVAARVSRNRVVRDGNHRFALLVEETALRYRIGPPDVMGGAAPLSARGNGTAVGCPRRDPVRCAARHVAAGAVHRVRRQRIEPPRPDRRQDVSGRPPRS